MKVWSSQSSEPQMSWSRWLHISTTMPRNLHVLTMQIYALEQTFTRSSNGSCCLSICNSSKSTVDCYLCLSYNTFKMQMKHEGEAVEWRISFYAFFRPMILLLEKLLPSMEHKTAAQCSFLQSLPMDALLHLSFFPRTQATWLWFNQVGP